MITLDPIKFNVSTGLIGLDSLNTRPTLINSVNLVGGTPEYLAVDITVSIYNPANLALNVGDLYLEIFNDGQPVGTTLLPDLHLVQGDNVLAVSSNFTPSANSEGTATLNQFVNGKDTQLVISGYPNSTVVESLLLAFESIAVNATLPGLNTSLFEQSALVVLPTTGYTNNISHVTVNIVNPFSANIGIVHVNSTVSAFGISLGSIFMPTNFTTMGNKTTTSPAFELNQNLDPPSLFTVLRVLAVEAGLSTEQIDGIVKLGGYSYIPAVNTTTNQTISTIATRSSLPLSQDELAVELSLGKRDNIYTGFQLPPFVDKAFSFLKADIGLVATLDVGGYLSDLTYSQSQVAVKTDQTLNFLLPVLARPIVQTIVDGSVLGFNTLLITNAKESSFDVEISGGITNAGPCEHLFFSPRVYLSMLDGH